MNHERHLNEQWQTLSEPSPPIPLRVDAPPVICLTAHVAGAEVHA